MPIPKLRWRFASGIKQVHSPSAVIAPAYRVNQIRRRQIAALVAPVKVPRTDQRKPVAGQKDDQQAEPARTGGNRRRIRQGRSSKHWTQLVDSGGFGVSNSVYEQMRASSTACPGRSVRRSTEKPEFRQLLSAGGGRPSRRNTAFDRLVSFQRVGGSSHRQNGRPRLVSVTSQPSIPRTGCPQGR